ncbi:hypothetical protein OAU37_00880 [Gammaproteobacteria bacterium]|nr:hypothetical protein [Gammaproteobacteria bacterium]
MGKKAKKHIQVFTGMSLYKREGSRFYWGYLSINKRVFKKSLGTEDRVEAEKLLFEWKSSLMTGDDSVIVPIEMKFSTFAEKLIKKQMEYDAPPSGIYTYKKTQGLLNRQKGLLEFFGNRDIRKISKQDIESFMSQLSLDGKTLTRGTIYKHINILKQILELADIEVSFPKIRGAKKAGQRGWFNLQNYKTILDKSNELVGKKFEIAKYKNIQITEDFHDFIIFMVGSMLRPTLSEVYSLKFKDINVKELDGVKYLEFTMQRKNQMMAVQTLPTSYYAYRDICNRRPDHIPEDYLFMPEYENRRTATGHMSKLFGFFLKEIGLQHDEDGNKLSTYSLRHTAITFNLSQKGVDSWDIMRRADTSKDMIEKYYYPRSQRDEKLKDFLRF